MVMQQKTQRPVQFEITEQTSESLLTWIRAAGRRSDDYLFPSRIHGSDHPICLHDNMRGLFVGIEVDDALETAEQTEV
jgi:hypothetical protein